MHQATALIQLYSGLLSAKYTTVWLEEREGGGNIRARDHDSKVVSPVPAADAQFATLVDVAKATLGGQRTVDLTVDGRHFMLTAIELVDGHDYVFTSTTCAN